MTFVRVGDCVAIMATMPDNSMDSIVCDPPYGYSFMGKGWDNLGSGNAQQAWHAQWLTEALRVVKPGGYLLAFSSSTTYHRLACAAEDVGFEIRDMLDWMYGQGVNKTAHDLKGSKEPILMARKPFTGTRRDHMATTGLGGLFIDGCRIATDEVVKVHSRGPTSGKSKGAYGDRKAQETRQTEGQKLGRWPPNVLLTHDAACACFSGTARRTSNRFDGSDYDPCWDGERLTAQHQRIRSLMLDGLWRTLTDIEDTTGDPPASISAQLRHLRKPRFGGFFVDKRTKGDRSRGLYEYRVDTSDNWVCAPDCPIFTLNQQSGAVGARAGVKGTEPSAVLNTGNVYNTRTREGVRPLRDKLAGAARFFYNSKANNRERWGICHDCGEVFCRGDKDDRARHKEHKVEWHPTVKPEAIMAWLVRLVTPEAGHTLDPFAGTGTTGVAALNQGFVVTLIEQNETYARIINARIGRLT
jgi:DNA modification methylase